MPSKNKGRGKGEDAASIRRIDSAQRQARALELRKAGATYDQIAKTVGYNSPQAAWVGVQAALDRTIREPADEYRKIHRERLETMLRALWPRVLRSDDHAIAGAMRILESLCKLMGLNPHPDVLVEATQMNVHQEVNQQVEIKVDLKTLDNGQLTQYAQLLAFLAQRTRTGAGEGPAGVGETRTG